MEEKGDANAGQTKSPMETLSHEELLQKCKGLLGIAKKAKQAKDEMAEENRRLKETLARGEMQKEADKKALLTMKEMLEQFTENKLQLTTQLSELQKSNRTSEEALAQLSIENESLKRQLDRLNDDNEALLSDVDRMEDQLKQVNSLGMEQKKHLGLLELEVNNLKEAENLNNALQRKVNVTQEENKALKEQENGMKFALQELTRKYDRIKEINTEQRQKFNALKERFVEVHRKLKKLKECKRVLLETQHEYAEAVSKWQSEIIKASRLLCAQMNALKSENDDLLRKLQSRSDKAHSSDISGDGFHVLSITDRIHELHALSVTACEEQQSQCAQLSTLQSENERLRQQLADTAKQETEVNNSDNAELESQHLEIKRLTQELTDLKIKLEHNEEKLRTTHSEKQDLEQKLLAHLDLGLEQKVQKLTQQMLMLNEECDHKVAAQQAECEQQQNELKSLREQINALEHERDTLRHECSNLAKVIAGKEQLEIEKLNESKKIHGDLQQIRNVLKDLEEEKIVLLAQLRRQEEQQLLAQQQEASERANTALHTACNCEELQARYAHKEREHADLLCEMRELNEALKGRGDVISRQQEKQQELVNELRKTTSHLEKIDTELKEKEQAIAQRDVQLREISEEIETTRAKVLELEEASAKSEQQINTLTDELQLLRSADAQTEILSTSTMSRAEELARLREVDDTFEDKYNKLRGLAVKLKKKLQEQTAYVAEMELQQSGHTALKQELEQYHKKVNELQLEQTQRQQLIDTLKAENQKLKTSRKQANVLNLEIEAAEKTLSEATSKLAAKTSELEALNEALNSKEHSIVQLRKEIAIVESAKAAECAHSKELKEQIDLLQEQIKDAVHSKQETLLANKELEQMQEQLRMELEEMRLQVAQNASKNENALSAVKSSKQQTEQKLLQTEATLNDTQMRLKNAERALEDLRVEYVDYKVKAQAVLRKNQSHDTSRERELTEEMLQLRTTEQQLRANVQQQTQQIAEQQRQAEQLQADNESQQRRTQELLRLVEELRQQNDHLATENRTQMLAQQETLRAQRQQLDSLDDWHKQQLQDLEACHRQQLEQLKIELAKAKRIPPIIGANAERAAAPAQTAEQSKIEFLLMEREDAEGSEEAEANANQAAQRKISSGSSRRSQHDFMPLDELLNAPMHAISNSVTTISGSNLGGAETALSGAERLQIELHATKEQLQKQESRVRHLTALLAENEQDLAKLTQMNDMLKEELRRQERSVEREQHMHNSEYLKNVIIKFLALNNGDERMRLVPVLNTILKLSRSETEMLNCVAKGQKVPSESHGRGWGNFLPSWGGGGSGGSNNNNP